MEDNKIINNEEVINERISSKTEEKVKQTFEPRNRAERRAAAKASKKKNKDKQFFMDNVQEAVKRLTYARLIQRLREKGEKENEEIEEGNANV